MRRFRRRRDEAPIDDEFPPEADAYDGDDAEPYEPEADAGFDEADDFDDDASPVQIGLRWRVLSALLVLAAVGALIASGTINSLPVDLVTQWPWLLVVLGVTWLLVGLVTAWAHGTLGGPLVIALGVVALLDQAAFTSTGTVIAGGLTLALGVAIFLRGVSMPRLSG